MNAWNFIFNYKFTKYAQWLILILFCVMRLSLPVSNLVYISFLYTNIIFLMMPIGLWGYVQKTTRLFESSYARVRIRDTRVNHLFLNVIVNDLVIVGYVLFNAFLIFCITFDFNDFSFVSYYLSTVVYWLCVYLFFISVFHFAYYICKDLKGSFFTSYAFLLSMSFATDIISPSIFTCEVFSSFNYTKIYKLISISLLILLCAHFILFKLGKGVCQVYENDKN